MPRTSPKTTHRAWLALNLGTYLAYAFGQIYSGREWEGRGGVETSEKLEHSPFPLAACLEHWVGLSHVQCFVVRLSEGMDDVKLFPHPNNSEMKPSEKYGSFP